MLMLENLIDLQKQSEVRIKNAFQCCFPKPEVLHEIQFIAETSGGVWTRLRRQAAKRHDNGSPKNGQHQRNPVISLLQTHGDCLWNIFGVIVTKSVAS
jgi:hypothetical protein